MNKPTEEMQFRANLEAIRDFDVEHLTNNQSPRTQKFPDVVPELTYVMTLAKEYLGFSVDDYRHFGPETLRALTTHSKDVVNNVVVMDAVNTPGSSAKQNANQILANIKKARIDFVSTGVPPLLYLRWIAQEQDAMQELRALPGQLREEADEELQKINSMKLESERILDRVKEVAGSVGVSEHAKVFGDTAKSHSKQATLWLVATAVAFIAAVLGAVWFTNEVKENYGVATNSTGSVIFAHTVARVVVVSLLLSLFFAVLKNYKSHRHLHVTNRHRADALKTFQVFTEATEDKNVKDTILQEAAKSIFTPAPTGYLGGKAETSMVPMLEILTKTKKP